MNDSTLIIFASGSKDGGGSGFEKLVDATREGRLRAKIVAVVSNHEHGGVRERADRLGIPFEYFPGPFPKFSNPDEEMQEAVDAEALRLVKKYNAEWIAFSGWLKLIRSLPANKTINIHPGLTKAYGGRFAGPGMFGHHVHEAVAHALEKGEIDHTGVTMHFVDPAYDQGPIFFEHRVSLQKGMTADEIGKAVNAIEHQYQPLITDMVVSGLISWDGKDTKSLKVPAGYEWLPSSK